MSFVYAAEALFFLGLAIWLIRWVGNTLREVSNTPDRATRHSASLEALMQDAMRHVDAAPPPARLTHGGIASLPSAGQATSPPVTVHCPACGTRVTDQPQPLPYTATCGGCAKRVNARGDGRGRMSVVVIDAPLSDERTS